MLGQSSQVTSQGGESERLQWPPWLKKQNWEFKTEKSGKLAGQSSREETYTEKRQLQRQRSRSLQRVTLGLYPSPDQRVQTTRGQEKKHGKKQNHSRSWHRAKKSSYFHQPVWKNLVMYETSGRAPRRECLKSGEKLVISLKTGFRNNKSLQRIKHFQVTKLCPKTQEQWKEYENIQDH